MKLKQFIRNTLLCMLALAVFGCGGGSDGEGADFVAPFSNFDAPVRLAFQNVPLRTAGQAFAPIRVAILDHNGRVVTTATNPVTIALANPGGATLSGTLTQNAVNGVATFNDLSVNIVGTYTFTASSPGLIGAESQNFNITPGTATQLTFTQQPTTINVGTPFNPTVAVTVRDTQGNLVDTTTLVTIVIANDPSGTATLAGTTQANTVNGVATFPGLTVNNGGGTGFVLAAAVTAGNTASNPFNVTGFPNQEAD